MVSQKCPRLNWAPRLEDQLIPLAARSKAWVCDRSLAWIAGSNAGWGMAVPFECCVSSGRGLYDGPIPSQGSPTECVCVCVCVCVIMCNSNPLHLPRVGRRGQNKKERKEKVMTTYVEMEVEALVYLSVNL